MCAKKTIILNIIALICFISVNGNKIPSSDYVKSSPTVFRNVFPLDNGNEVKTQYDCSSSRMTVTGFDIRISEIVNHDYWSTASDIQILALNKIYIDCDIIKNSAHLYVFAPTWECIGLRKIIVSGKDGESHSPSTAPGNGTSGEPGLPGGAGGIFIGIGQHLINSNELRIEANGGNGGPGQNGGIGIDGIDGDEFKTNEFIQTIEWDSFNFDEILNELKFNFSKSNGLKSIYPINYPIQIYNINGQKATSSGDGGDGGVGGHGGLAGFIYLNGFDSLPKLEVVDGKNGSIGKGGHPGNPAHNGRNEKCFLSHAIKFFGCQWTDSTTTGSIGKNGIDGGNEANRKEPQIPINTNYTDVINSFKQYIRIYLLSI